MKWKSLLVAPDRKFAARFAEGLERFCKGKSEIHCCQGIESGLGLASHHLPVAIFIDEVFGETEISRFIREVRRELPHSVHIMMTDGGGATALQRARQAGAWNYMPKNGLDPAGFGRCLEAVPLLERG